MAAHTHERIITDNIATAANQISTASSNFTRSKDTLITNTRNAITTHWNSPAASAAIALMNINNSLMTNHATILDNYSVFLNQQIGVGYETTETRNVSYASEFL